MKCLVCPGFVLSLQLNFIGVTVAKDRRYLHFPSTQHVFAPVAIGGFYPPKQVWSIYLDATP